jgi:signal peptidase I
MEPTLRAGQSFRARAVKPGAYRPGRGDVVVFDASAAWRATGVVVLRVIGIGGDVVACCDPGGKVLLNGKPLDEPYLGADSPLDASPGDCGRSRRFASVAVPEGQLFVMGDHRLVSSDSRCAGSIPVDQVIGVVQT